MKRAVAVAAFCLLVAAAPARAAAWSTPVTVGEDAPSFTLPSTLSLAAGIDDEGRGAILWQPPRGLVFAACSAAGRCSEPKLLGPLPEAAALAVTPRGATYIAAVDGTTLSVRSAATPTSALGPARKIDTTARYAGDGTRAIPVLTVTQRGHAVLAWRRRGGKILLADLTAGAKPRTVIKSGRVAALAGDARGNLVVVWSKPARGPENDTAYVTRVAADGAVGPSRVVSREIDYSFPQFGGARAALLAGGRTVAALEASYYDPGDSSEGAMDWLTSSASPAAGLVTTTPRGLFSAPAVLPAGDRRALVIWNRYPGIKAAFYDDHGFGRPAIVTKTLSSGFNWDSAAGAGNAALITWAENDKTLLTASLGPGATRFARADAVPTPAGDARRTTVQEAVPALAPNGRAMVVFAMNRPDSGADRPPDAIRVSFGSLPALSRVSISPKPVRR